ncbi:response regulator transcription factor [Algibacillus agarilyticus]|uniref:response regulator transcription factor n=1 Tax=Algibacillus agarilyticus TaxID=2234133 RepID=UPI000DCFD34B|nr:response regulator transcription factor [Algibacillus agarilyticus]
MDRVLIVEDEQDIADLIKVNLAELAIETAHANNGQQALDLALNHDFELILLDIMLPGLSGLDVCRQVKDKKPHQAIMMLTSRNSETDQVVGLELGADDYMTKPFSVRELQARVRSHLRRVHVFADLQKASNTGLSQQAPANNEGIIDTLNNKAINIGALRINAQKHDVELNNTKLDLTTTEFDLLLFLATHPEQVFSRAQLLDSVWGYQHSGYEHTVNSHINRLRSKIESNVSEPKIIQTVWGVGYKFDPASV